LMGLHAPRRITTCPSRQKRSTSAWVDCVCVCVCVCVSVCECEYGRTHNHTHTRLVIRGPLTKSSSAHMQAHNDQRMVHGAGQHNDQRMVHGAGQHNDQRMVHGAGQHNDTNARPTLLATQVKMKNCRMHSHTCQCLRSGGRPQSARR
jgi:hypothetical protein